MSEGPERTCLGCGKPLPKDGLLRYVAAPDGTLVADLKGKLPGRGAYTCQSAACIAAAVKKKGFSRSFRRPVQADGAALLDSILHQLRERIGSYLSLAAKGGKLVSGSDAVAEALRKPGKVGTLFLASDSSEETARRFVRLAEREGAEVVSLFDKDTLGRLIGKEFRTVVAVETGGFSASIRRETTMYRNFDRGVE
ncbi:MAG TPA: DUF448 domain-containing protein [Verrucomicrobiae bacterium]|nr:DUF448 domain-containing protein [Verrucomicrobiae bacterium]